MLDDIEHLWKREGIEDRLHLERFEIARSADASAGGTVTFAKADRKVAVDGATTLLQAGEDQGVAMPFGCRMGICQTCVVPLTEGYVRDLRSGKEHGPGDRIQTCISVAAGDCTLEA
jgi:ferredoxin